MTASTELLDAIADVKVRLGYAPDVAVHAYVLAEHLPEQLRSEFWREAIGRYLDHADALLVVQGVCEVCDKPTTTPPECGACVVAEENRWRDR